MAELESLEQLLVDEPNMSTIKSPGEKKLLSLQRDRRNVYGENPTSSRKNIARGKQRGNQRARTIVAEVLAIEAAPSAVLDLEKMDAEVKTREIGSKSKKFRKKPDAPLLSLCWNRRLREDEVRSIG